MEHYAITVLRAEKYMWEYELFKMKKYNDSHFAHETSWKLERNVYHLPEDLKKIEDKINDLNEAIEWMTERAKIR